MGERKIVQISAYATSNEQQYAEGVYALCDDGTVWGMTVFGAGTKQWAALPPIPQPEARDAQA